MYKPENDTNLDDAGLSDNIPDKIEFVEKGFNESVKDIMDDLRNKCINFSNYVQGLFVKPMPKVKNATISIDIETLFNDLGTYNEKRDDSHESPYNKNLKK